MNATDHLFDQLAKQYLAIDTLETRQSDQLDFHEVSVWSIKRLLNGSFFAGQRQGMADALGITHILHCPHLHFAWQVILDQGRGLLVNASFDKWTFVPTSLCEHDDAPFVTDPNQVPDELFAAVRYAIQDGT